MFKGYINKIKEPHLYRATLLFVFAFVLGLTLAYSDPEMIKAVMQTASEWIEPLRDLSGWRLFGAILLNNGVKILMAVVLGVIFGIVPFLFIFGNGMMLGVISYLHVMEHSIFSWAVGLLPHGVFEIPALVVAGAVGLMLGSKVWKRVFRQEAVDFKDSFLEAINFSVKIILPIIIIAALIEVFITLPLFNSLFGQ